MTSGREKKKSLQRRNKLNIGQCSDEPEAFTLLLFYIFTLLRFDIFTLLDFYSLTHEGICALKPIFLQIQNSFTNLANESSDPAIAGICANRKYVCYDIGNCFSRFP